VRIRGGTARAYYVAVESVMPAVPGLQPPVQALCLAPFGMEEGSEAALPAQEFGLVVGEQVRFRFFGSSVRRQDEVGTLLDDWEPDELQELDEIQTTLPSRRPPPPARWCASSCTRASPKPARSNSRPCRTTAGALEGRVRRARRCHLRGVGSPGTAMKTRYIVGIDLGTSNTVVAYSRHAGEDSRSSCSRSSSWSVPAR
jgi:hypothetical protein